MEDQAPRQVLGRAVLDGGERADRALVLRDGARHRRPPAAAGRNGRRKKSIDSGHFTARWNDIRQRFVDYYRPGPSADEAARTAHKRLERAAEQTYDEFCKKLKEYFQANVDDIVAYFGALDRFEDEKGARPAGPVPEAAALGPDDGAAPRGDKWIKDIEARKSRSATTFAACSTSSRKSRARPE